MLKSLKSTEIIAGLVVIAVLLLGISQIKPNPNLLRFKVEGERAYGYGFTDDRSVSVVNKLLRDHPQVTTLVLQDMPGTQDADANLILARRIRKLGLNTHLSADSYIASGAVDLFLAGNQRSMDCGAKIGVHAWSMGGVMDAQDAYFDDRRRRQEGFLRDMGIDPDFYVFTREAAPASGIHWMRVDEINRFMLTSEPLNCS